MKKIIGITLALVMLLSLATLFSCFKLEEDTPSVTRPFEDVELDKDGKDVFNREDPNDPITAGHPDELRNKQ